MKQLKEKKKTIHNAICDFKDTLSDIQAEVDTQTGDGLSANWQLLAQLCSGNSLATLAGLFSHKKTAQIVL